MTCHQYHVADYSTQSAAMDFMAGFSPADGFLPDHPEYVEHTLGSDPCAQLRVYSPVGGSPIK